MTKMKKIDLVVVFFSPKPSDDKPKVIGKHNFRQLVDPKLCDFFNMLMQYNLFNCKQIQSWDINQAEASSH